ncbi:MAG: STAS domain-containing protein [Oscillospiraceae bacterium]|nr:STAS domain-containing protein [Oscillospiraceae bacterium]
MTITKTVDDKSLTLALEGRLDTATAPELDAELQSSLDGVETLILDLEKLQYMSSAGLRILLLTQKRMMKQGQMKVLHVGETIMEIFEVTGFSEILTIE